MKVVIVAKTRMGSGACIGGITFSGQSVRLVAADAEINEHFNQEYEIGDVWDVSYKEDLSKSLPHVENIVVYDKTKMPPIDNIVTFIEEQMAPVSGGVELLYNGLAQATKEGVQYIAARTGIPPYSTMFWRPDRPLQRCDDAKRIRYRYPSENDGRTLTFVGFQEPLVEIPAGAILRVSLAHWWRPDRLPDGELRCYVQLSGWYFNGPYEPSSISSPGFVSKPVDVEDIPFEKAHDVLELVFGHDSFRPLQEEIIGNVLQRNDSLVIMPTGSGKSICYQLPALLFPGLTVVVSPLISLMQDQVEQLRQHGIAAEFLNSTLSYSEHLRITERLRDGEIKLLYAAPETLLRPETMLLLQKCRVDCLTIDEAHCISQWGHDFRPEYRQLISLREHLPQAVCLAVTATATGRVRKDIKHILKITDADEFIASFDRKNLFLATDSKRDSMKQILDFIRDHQDQAGIIYCNTRREVNDLADRLAAEGLPALPYHAELDNNVRQYNQRRFSLEEGLIVVATIAFGMGIDKSNVRFVVHYGLPKNLESYYQQIGRSGRDGLQADCLLLFSRKDIRTIQYFIKQQDKSQQTGAKRRLWSMLEYAETPHCRRIPLLSYFGETISADNCGMCDNCVSDQTDLVEQDDITTQAQMFLSCVYRTNQIYGAVHIVDILRGSRSQRVLKRNHDKLSTHGIGQEFSKAQWLDLADQFRRLGLLNRDTEHGSLRLSEQGNKVLHHNAKVTGYIPEEKSTKPRRRLRDSSKSYDLTLFELLRDKRTELARQANVPPYVIFSDRSLSEMAAKFPQTERTFANINGVGKYKLGKYASEFLPIIRAYCRANENPDTQTEE